MRTRSPRQVVSPLCGFTLIETLITLVLIGIIVALLTPKVMQAREEALRQGARQSTIMLEKALANWVASQPTIGAASAVWDSYDPDADGYIGLSNNASSHLNDFLTKELSAYLPSGNGQAGQVGSFIVSSSARSISTPDMRRLAGSNYIGGNTNADSAAPWAHLRLYWEKGVNATTNTNNRMLYSPKVLLFLPTIP